MAQEDFFEGTKKGLVTMTVSKDEMELFESIRKIKPEQWKEFKGFMSEAKDILTQGGLTAFFRADLATIKDDIYNMFFDPLLAPILEALAPIIAEFMEEIIPVIQDLLPFLRELATGLSTAIEALKSVSIQLPGGSEWDMFWSGTLDTLETLINDIKDIFAPEDIAGTIAGILEALGWTSLLGGVDDDGFIFY